MLLGYQLLDLIEDGLLVHTASIVAPTRLSVAADGQNEQRAPQHHERPRARQVPQHAHAEAGQQQDEAEVQEPVEVVGAPVTETWKIGALSEPDGEHWSESILPAG